MPTTPALDAQDRLLRALTPFLQFGPREYAALGITLEEVNELAAAAKAAEVEAARTREALGRIHVALRAT